MDCTSHIIFGLTITRLAYMNHPLEWEKHRNIIIPIAIAASMFPGLDLPTTQLSEIHAPRCCVPLQSLCISPTAIRGIINNFIDNYYCASL